MVEYYIEETDIDDIHNFVKKFAQPELITLLTIWPVTVDADYAVYVNPERSPNAAVMGDCGLIKFTTAEKQKEFIEKLTASLTAASIAFQVDNARGRVVVELWKKMKEIRLQRKAENK